MTRIQTEGVLYIKAFDFDSMIKPLGKTLLPGRAAAVAVFEALADMARRCESVVEEIALRREAYDLIIATRTDEVGSNEGNIDTVCAALMQASAICAFGHDEETFWLEITVPGVFEADSFDPSHKEVSFAGEKRASVDVEEELPEWLTNIMRAAKGEQERLSRKDFAIDHPQMDALLDLYGAFRRVAAEIAAEFVFNPPKLPTKEHGSCYLVAEKLTLRKEDIQTLFSLIARASSFGINYCADDRVRLGVEISFVYNLRD